MRAAIILAVLLAGCVTAKTEMLDDRTAIISGKGSGFDNSASLIKKILVAAATKAQERGFEYFQIVGSKDTTTTSLYIPPQTSTTNVTGNSYCTGYWCSGSANATTFRPGGAAIPIARPGADVMIRLLHAGEFKPGASGVFNTAAVLAEAN